MVILEVKVPQNLPNFRLFWSFLVMFIKVSKDLSTITYTNTSAKAKQNCQVKNKPKTSNNPGQFSIKKLFASRKPSSLFKIIFQIK